MRIGIIAPSSVVASEELKWGVELLKSWGFVLKVHSQCRKKHLFYAGTAEERARAFTEMAWDLECDAIWSARGGYGAHQLLSALDAATRERGVPPRKLLIGYSDSTSLLEYVRRRWNWPVLHAVMPGHRGLLEMSPQEEKRLLGCIRKSVTDLFPKSLKFMGDEPRSVISGTLVGGNLSILASLIGTPHAFSLDGQMLFLEEVTETPSRIDRMIGQLLASGAADHLRAIILGDFTACEDAVPLALGKVNSLVKARAAVRQRPFKPSAPLRAKVPLPKALKEIFRPFWEIRGIPVAYGLPVGHGLSHLPLPLGASYELDKNGRLRLLSWNWIVS